MSAPSDRVTKLLSELTAEDKADLVTGEGMWTTRAIERLGLPGLKVTDGPNGARGDGLMGTGTATACIPAGSVIGAMWDAALVEELGGLLGDESVAKGSNVLLAPTINLHRSPLGGRNFECYSEDPFLTGKLAAAFVRGVQSKGVATTAKHFVGNDSEFERNTINTVASERTLRELYLVPFELVVKEANAWGIMSAYNRINGPFCAESEWLLSTVLREQWGFDGFVVSDWFGTRSTAASIRAGLSLEMPGRGNYYGKTKIAEALASGEIDEAHLDAVATDMLVAMERTGALDGVGQTAEKPLDRPEDRALNRRAAAAGTILVRNNGVLPLNPASLSSLAVIGPNARKAKIMGGGSAAVRAYHRQSPFDALLGRLGDQLELHWAQGSDINRSTPSISAPMLDGPLTATFYNGHNWEGSPVGEKTLMATQMMFFGQPLEGIASDFSVRATGTLKAPATGSYQMQLVQSGRTRVLLDGKVVFDALEDDLPKGDAYFGMGTAPIHTEVELQEGVASELVIEYHNQGAVLLAGADVGIIMVSDVDLLAEAEKVASSCDAAVVVVGTNDDWETEGRDRDQFALPGDQVELIRRVAAVNDKTVVVMNVGGPHAMEWIDVPAAVLNVGFGGQEMAESLVDVLVGQAEPGGRMPYSVPMYYEQATVHPNYPGENSEVHYGEGVFMGYRGYDARLVGVAVPFGHGMSYASFDWSAPRVPDTAPTSVGEITVQVDVTNTSDRAGVEVVQVYVESPDSRLQRPPRELKGFAKLHLEPGQTSTAEIALDFRSFAYFDSGDQVLGTLAAGAPVPAGQGIERRTEPGWYVDPGTYRIVVAKSVTDHMGAVHLTLTGDEARAPA